MTTILRLHSAIANLVDCVTGKREDDGLNETPERAAKAWQFWCSGEHEDPAECLKTFDMAGWDYDEIVLVKDIPLYSHCEHHLAPIIGRATVGYIPNERIVGLSKISRVVNGFARRLQVQERLTSQIAHCINDALQPRGVAVQVRARHLCMESRGICQQGHHTVTQKLLGVFHNEPEARAEFISLAKSDALL
ncbi:GTP cyclohydrolase I [Synechococcus phage Yong-L2-223]|nr:GTP cyclohydrolase I [Synechococcus phage Yong-L2-223]